MALLRQEDTYRPFRPAQVYLDEWRLPAGMTEFSVSQKSKNEEGSTFDGDPITRPRKMDPQTFTIETVLTFEDDFFINNPDTWHERRWFTDEFWYKNQDEAYWLISILYPDGTQFNSYAMLNTWDYKQSGSDGSDWHFTLNFTEAYPRENQEIKYSTYNPYIKVGGRDSRRVS